MAIFISSAQAINISSASVQCGLAVVSGGKAAANANISWEGRMVAKANKNGGFSFSGVVPSDCVGTLSDGVSTINVAISGCTPVVSGAPASVPQTGQTISLLTGDDGDLEKGVVLPTPRFTDNSNGTLKDNLTGLIWLKNANCLNGTTSWLDAFTAVASLNSTGTINGNDCGDTSNAGSYQTDWRLPKVRELFSLVNFGFDDYVISNAAGTGQGNASDPLSNLQFGYWSSTTFALTGSDGWMVDLNRGGANFSLAPNYVLAVRGGS